VKAIHPKPVLDYLLAELRGTFTVDFICVAGNYISEILALKYDFEVG
jgi:hypothetical protein